MRRPHARWLAIALVAFFGFAGHASAQDAADASSATPADAPSAPADPGAEAHALFRRGLELGAQDRWADALSLFLRSRSLVQRPSTLFNIGVALGRLGRFREALATLDEFLALPADVTGEARGEAQRLRDEASAALAELTLAIAPDDAAVEVDGASREGTGSPRVVALDPGRHILRARREGYDDGILELSVLAAEHTDASLTLAARVLEPPPPPPPPPGTSLVDDPLFWVVVVGTTLAVGAAIGVGVGVSSSQSPPPNGGSTGVVLTLP